MLSPLEGPGISQGKGFVMSTVKEEKKMTHQGGTCHKQECAIHPFEGKVVSMTGDKLVMTNKEGEEYTHTLAKDATVTCDGAVCKAEDIKAGRKIRVTTPKNDRKVATSIESLDKYAEFAKCSS